MRKHHLPESLVPKHLQRDMPVRSDAPRRLTSPPMFTGKASNTLPSLLIPPERMESIQFRPRHPISPDLSDAQFINAYKRELGGQEIIPRTVRSYTAAVEHFAGFLATQNKTLKQAAFEDAEAYAAFLHRREKLPGFRLHQVGSADIRLTALRGFYRFLVHERVLPDSPFIDARKTGNREEVVVLSPEQIQTLESAIPNSPFTNRLRAFFNLLHKTGISPEDVAALQRADVQPEQAQMKVTSKNGKTRIIENLHLQVIAAFNASQEHSNLSNPYAFPQLRPKNSERPVSPAVVHSSISDLGIIAGVRCTAGMLRDTFAVEALGNKRPPESIIHDMGMPADQFHKRYEEYIA